MQDEEHEATASAPGRTRVSFDDEPLICVDAHDRVLAYRSKADCHDGQGVLHRALSVFLFDPQGRLLLQQRSHHKRLWPKWWANSCCSHPRRGEEVQAAAGRRLQEELGVEAALTLTHRFEYQAPFGDAGSEHELCSVFVAVSDAPVHAHPDEVMATAWWAPEALDEALRDAQAPYTPWLRMEWAALRAHHWPVVQGLLARHARTRAP